MVGHILQSSNNAVLHPLRANAAGAEESRIRASAARQNTSNAISVQNLNILVLSVDRPPVQKLP